MTSACGTGVHSGALGQVRAVTGSSRAAVTCQSWRNAHPATCQLGWRQRLHGWDQKCVFVYPCRKGGGAQKLPAARRHQSIKSKSIKSSRHQSKPSNVSRSFCGRSDPPYPPPRPTPSTPPPRQPNHTTNHTHPIPNSSGPQLIRSPTHPVPNMPLIKQASTKQAPNVHQTCTKHAPSKHQTSIKQAPNMHQTCIKRASNMHQTCIKHADFGGMRV